MITYILGGDINNGCRGEHLICQILPQLDNSNDHQPPTNNNHAVYLNMMQYQKTKPFYYIFIIALIFYHWLHRVDYCMCSILGQTLVASN